MKRENLIKGMIFSNGEESLQLESKDGSNVWYCIYLHGEIEEENIRHDYIFTNKIYGYKLVGFRAEDVLIGKEL